MGFDAGQNFESLGVSTQGSLRQLYFIECLEATGKKLDPFFAQQKKGIKALLTSSTSLLPESEKQEIEKRARGYKCRQ